MKGFQNFSDEIVLEIFRFLDTQNILNCKKVCKQFHRVCQDSSLFRRFCVCSDLPVTSASFHKYMNRYHASIRHLTLRDCFWIPSVKLASSLTLLKEIRELNVTGSRLSVSGLLKVFSNNNHITKLKWSVPNVMQPLHVTVLNDIQSAFTMLSSLVLYFETLNSFEQLLPVFNAENIFVNEFGLHYLKSSSSNTYGIYIKSCERFQLYLQDAAVSTRFLHFNLLIMDFVIQTVSKAAETKGITSLLARGNTICWKHISAVLNTYSFENIDMSFSTLGKYQMAWLSKLSKLRHLNLSHVGQFKANLMKAIATNCTNLQSLNLSHCEHWINKDLHGLEAVASCCPMLTELNLACLHLHSSNSEYLNKLCTLVSQMKLLKALSLPACGLVNNIEIERNDQSKSTSTSPTTLFKSRSYKSKVQSNLLISLDASSVSSSSSSSSAAVTVTPLGPQTDSSGYTTRLSRVSNHINNTGLDTIVLNCPMLENLEIIDTGFHSIFSRAVVEHFNCALTARLSDKCFNGLALLKNLTQLTLAGLSGTGAFNSLSLITSSCTRLEYLSLSHCGLAGNPNSLVSLKSALKFCKVLKHLRIEQPYFQLKENLLESMHGCKQIQTMALILKNGKIITETAPYMNLFSQCPCLVGFFVFSSATISECKRIQNAVSKRFCRIRAALCVSLLPYNVALTEEGLRNVPYRYQRDHIQFESRVAVSREDC